MLTHFFKGVMMGFYIAIPFGVVSVIYLKRTLKNGLASGIASALGVSTGEAFYGAVVIFGLYFVSDFLLAWESEMKLCGAFFLLFIGIKSFFSNPAKGVKIDKRKSLISDYFSMLVLSIFNPIAIVGFATIFASFGASSLQNYSDSAIMLLGFAIASFSYCLILIAVAVMIKNKFYVKDVQLLEVLNQVSGVVIIIFTILIFTFSFLKQ